MSDMEPGMHVLTTLGEAGGISGMVLVVAGLLLRMIKRNGCTCKCYNCHGAPLAEVDCEHGAATRRYIPKAASPTATPSVETQTETERV